VEERAVLLTIDPRAAPFATPAHTLTETAFVADKLKGSSMNRFVSIVVATVVASFAASALADRTLMHEAVINAPLADVWNAFTTNEGFESWAVARAEIDLRIGGEMRTHYDPNGAIGDKNTIVNQILAFEPQRMLAIRNVKAPDGFPHVELFSKTWSVIHFEPVDDPRDRTRVRIVGMGYGEGAEWDELHSFFKAGNQQTLDALKKKFDANAMTDDPERVMTLLGKLAGGEWIHEGTPPGAPAGTVFRVRNVIEHGPDGKSLIMRGWLGNQEGMSPHSACLVWLQPGDSSSGAPAEVRFRNIDEGSGVVAGAIRLVGSDSVEWDWTRTAQDGMQSRFRVTMGFIADDQYALKIDALADDGTASTMVQADFNRVARAPDAFLRMRAK
jgi:uncharacterized protein YndB with AHSA1/START domain